MQISLVPKRPKLISPTRWQCVTQFIVCPFKQFIQPGKSITDQQRLKGIKKH